MSRKVFLIEISKPSREKLVASVCGVENAETCRENWSDDADADTDCSASVLASLRESASKEDHVECRLSVP